MFRRDSRKAGFVSGSFAKETSRIGIALNDMAVIRTMGVARLKKDGKL